MRASIFATICVLLASCVMDDEERMEKARAAMVEEEYREAWIQLKNVAQNQPDNAEARRMLGQASLELGQLDAAATELRRALDLGADEAVTRILLGRTLLAQGRAQELLETVPVELAVDDSQRLEILVLRGQAELALGQVAEAELAFREALDIDGESVAGHLGLAATHVAWGRYAEADTEIDRAMAIDGDHVPAWLARGELRLREARYAEAVEAFEEAAARSRAQALERGYLVARVGQADAELGQRDHARARETVDELLRLAPQDLRVRFLDARVAAETGDHDRAVEQLQSILADVPEHRPTQQLLGTLHYLRSNYALAEMYLGSVVAAQPNNGRARSLLMRTKARQGNYDEARDLGAAGLEQGTGDAELLRLMGEVNIQGGDIESGLEYLQRSAEAAPDNRSLQLELALGHLYGGDMEGAIAVLEQLPAAGAEGASRDVLLVLAHLRNQNIEAAREQAQAFLERAPDDPQSHILAGAVEVAAEQFAAGRAEFERALELDEDSLAALVNLARLDLREDKPGAAKARLQRVRELQPGNLFALLALAQLAGREGDAEAAVELLEEARTAHPDVVEPRLALARLYLSRGDYQGASGAAAEAARIAPGRGDIQNVLGLTELALGRRETALASFEAAVAAEPDSATYRFNHGRGLAALGRQDEAAQALRTAFELNPDYLQAAALLASVEIERGRYEEARALISDLRAQHPESHLGKLLEGDLLARQEDFGAAAAAYAEAFRQAPDRVIVLKEFEVRRRGQLADPGAPLEAWLDEHPADGAVRLALAQFRQEEGDRSGAIRQYEALLEHQPENPVALNNLAWLYYESGDERALALAERAYQAAPDAGSIIDTLGWLLIQKGDLERGTGLLRRAAQQEPQIGEIQYHLAVALAKSGARDEARGVLTELLASDQDFASVNEAQSLLREL